MDFFSFTINPIRCDSYPTSRRALIFFSTFEIISMFFHLFLNWSNCNHKVALVPIKSINANNAIEMSSILGPRSTNI